MAKTLTQADLHQFTGTENYFKHWTQRLVYTDGVKHMAEAGEAYWLIDAIASHQPTLRHAELREFQLWTLRKNKTGNGAVLTCAADSGRPPAITQRISFTDFPLNEVKLYVEGGVLLLPSEH